jgi:hypothetical protein
MNNLNNLNYINSFFYIGEVPYKITKLTAKTIFYKECIIDNLIIVNSGNILQSCDKKYYHYSNFYDPFSAEHKITTARFEKLNYEVIDNLDHTVYNYNIPGYYQSIFFNDTNLLKKIYQLQYYIESYKIISELLDSLDQRTDEKGILLFNKNVDLFDEVKSNIYNLTKKDDQIVNELFNYNKYIMSLRKMTYIVKSVYDEFIEKMDKLIDECPICLDEKSCTIGHFLCSHHLCNDCYKQLNSKICMLCRSL